MADPVSLPLEVDPADIEQGIYDYIQSFFPEWEPKEPHLAVLMSEAIAVEVSELRRLATDVGPEFMMYLGRMLGVFPVEALPAVGVVNITAIDNAGYTIPAGTEMRILVHGDEYVGFETIDDAVIAPGQTVASNVDIKATTEGVIGNGLTTDPQLLDLLDYISAISTVGSTSGGLDLEDTDVYLERLRTRLQLLADRPIIPRDFEIYAETIVPGVYRALCLDTYDPVSDTYNNERMITMIALDETGAGVNSTVKGEMQDVLDAAREVNFIVNTMDPTYTAVTVSATVVAHPGWDLATLEGIVTEAVIDYLNPATFGSPGTGTGISARRWIKKEKVRYSELMWVILGIEGVGYIDGAITINGNANTDLVLAGEAPLPAANPTVSITVNAP